MLLVGAGVVGEVLGEEECFIVVGFGVEWCDFGGEFLCEVAYLRLDEIVDVAASSGMEAQTGDGWLVDRIDALMRSPFSFGASVLRETNRGPVSHHGGYDPRHERITFDPSSGRLCIRYRAPTPIEQPLEIRIRLERCDGRKLFIGAECRSDGVLIASAEAVYIVVDPTRFLPDPAKTSSSSDSD